MVKLEHLDPKTTPSNGQKFCPSIWEGVSKSSTPTFRARISPCGGVSRPMSVTEMQRRCACVCVCVCAGSVCHPSPGCYLRNRVHRQRASSCAVCIRLLPTLRAVISTPSPRSFVWMSVHAGSLNEKKGGRGVF